MKDLREQTQWVRLFHCKNNDSFDKCLQEIYNIPSLEKHNEVWQLLATTKHAKFNGKHQYNVQFIGIINLVGR